MDAAAWTLTGTLSGVVLTQIANEIGAQRKHDRDVADTRRKEAVEREAARHRERRAAYKQFLIAMRRLHDAIGVADLSSLPSASSPKERLQRFLVVAPEASRLMEATLDAETEVDMCANSEMRRRVKEFKQVVSASAAVTSLGGTGDYVTHEEELLARIAAEDSSIGATEINK